MKKVQLDTIILFSLIIPFIMTYRISPGDTPYWLFSIIFLGLFITLILDIKLIAINDKLYQILKIAILWLLIFSSIGAGLFSAIIVRHETAPYYNVHDIILQQEAAIRFMLHGKNPYTSTYFNTPMAQWHYSDTEVNPALYHFVMEPFYLIFAVPFYIVMSRTAGFFDARVPLFFLFVVMLFVAQKIPKTENSKRLLVTLVAFNPATLGYFIEGRDDIFMFAFMVIGFFFMQKGKNIFASIFMALAFAIKQSAWPLFPFYIFYLYFKERSLINVAKNLLAFGMSFLVIVVPFVLWNFRGFIDSTILYLSGNVPHSYPIAGYGFGMLLNSIGVIKDVHMYYPFWIWQVIICLPLMIIFLILQYKHNNVKTLILLYGLFLFVFWYFSRYFNNSHLGYLSMVFIIAYFWPDDKKIHPKKDRSHGNNYPAF